MFLRRFMGLGTAGACASIVVVLMAGVQAEAAPTKCTLSAGAAADPGEKIDPAIVLTPEAASQSRIVNFDSGRDEKLPVFHLEVEPAMKQADLAKLSLNADPLVRTGNDKVETVDFSDLLFTPLKLTNGGTRITFGVCLRPPKDLPAGKYTGVITVDGPSGVTAKSVSITANAKNGGLFSWGVALTLALAYLVLLYKAAAEARAAEIAAKKKEMEGETDPDKLKRSAKKAARWGTAFGTTFKDVGFEFRALLTLGATFGALYALWENNAAWGDAGTITSLVALVGVGLAAVGVRAIMNPSTTPPTGG